MALGRDERVARFLEWSLLTDGQRAALGYPATREGFAKAIGTSDKTLQRDAAEPAFKDELAKRRRELAGLAVPGAVLDAGAAAGALAAVAAAQGGDGTSIDVVMPRALAALTELVEAKDRGAIQILLSTPSAKAWFDAQLKDATSELGDLSLLELARLNCEFIPTDILAQLLAERAEQVAG